MTGPLGHLKRYPAQKYMKPWQHRFQNHMNDAEMFMSQTEYGESFRCFKNALAEIPEPRADHYEATQAVTGVADCYYFLGQYENAEQPLRDVLLLPEGAANPYIRLRRGQVFNYLGDLPAARTEWTCAYLNGGAKVFDGETDCAAEIQQLVAELEEMPDNRNSA